MKRRVAIMVDLTLYMAMASGVVHISVRHLYVYIYIYMCVAISGCIYMAMKLCIGVWGTQTGNALQEVCEYVCVCVRGRGLR